MILSSRTVRKLKRLRRRAWVLALVLGSGCAYVGGRLALAHSRPVQPLPDIAAMPAWAASAQTGYAPWLQQGALSDQPLTLVASATPADAWSDPRIHQAEEKAAREEGTAEYSLQGSDWSYSSLDGVQRAAAAAAAPTAEALAAMGCDGSAPVWASMLPAALATRLPEGVAPGADLVACQARLWPQRQAGELAFWLKQPIAPQEEGQPTLADMWKQLPAGRTAFCLRRSALAAVLQGYGPAWSQSVIRKLLLPADQWVGLSTEAEVDADSMQQGWNRLQMGWTPMSLFSDQAVAGVATSQTYGMSSSKQGTVFRVGCEGAAGPSTAPWEGWQLPGQPQEWLGAGRFAWKHGDTTQRVEWVAVNGGHGIDVHFRWKPEAQSDKEFEVASQLPDEETIYHPKPNVIAGQ